GVGVEPSGTVRAPRREPPPQPPPQRGREHPRPKLARMGATLVVAPVARRQVGGDHKGAPTWAAGAAPPQSPQKREPISAGPPPCRWRPWRKLRPCRRPARRKPRWRRWCPHRP